MPIKKRIPPMPLNDPAIIDIVNDAVNSLNALLGLDVNVSVVIERKGKANIITNEVDYERLSDTLQSIVSDRQSFGPIT